MKLLFRTIPKYTSTTAPLHKGAFHMVCVIIRKSPEIGSFVFKVLYAILQNCRVFYIRKSEGKASLFIYSFLLLFYSIVLYWSTLILLIFISNLIVDGLGVDVYTG